MPTTRRRRIRGRTGAVTFESIDSGERTRWALGLPLVAGHFEPVAQGDDEEDGGAPRVRVWPGWGELFQVYLQVRDKYLAEHAQRLRAKPGIELLYEAWRAGADPSAVVLPQERDPRVALMAMLIDEKVRA